VSSGSEACPHSRADEPATDAKWTIPNALSVLRLLGVPLFLWLLLGPHADVLALVVLAVAGFTDWLDGVIARTLHQTSRLGALLDPAADRLYILSTLIGLVLRHVIPWELAGVIIARDLLLLLTVPGLRRLGLTALPVHYLGKAATFALLYAFPLLLLGTYDTQVAEIAKPIAWAFTLWGTGLYLWAGVVYVMQYRIVVGERAT
jgi:cardiolipin synthase